MILFELNLEVLWPAVDKEIIRVDASSEIPSGPAGSGFHFTGEHQSGSGYQSLTEIGGEKLEAVSLFDVYQGDNIPNGYRSLAFSLTFRIPDRTLQDEEVNTIMEAIIKAAAERFGAQFRA